MKGCQMKTQKGKQCQRETINQNKFCWQHMKQSGGADDSKPKSRGQPMPVPVVRVQRGQPMPVRVQRGQPMPVPVVRGQRGQPMPVPVPVVRVQRGQPMPVPVVRVQRGQPMPVMRGQPMPVMRGQRGQPMPMMRGQPMPMMRGQQGQPIPIECCPCSKSGAISRFFYSLPSVLGQGAQLVRTVGETTKTVGETAKMFKKPQ